MSELDKAVEQLHNEGYSSENIKLALDKIKEETRKQPVITGNLLSAEELQMNELKQYKIKYNLPGVRGIFYKTIEADNKTEARKIFKIEVPKAIYIVIDEIKEGN